MEPRLGAEPTAAAAAADPHTGAARWMRVSDAPFPGLRPFAREESDIFFGREEQVDELLLRLGRSRFLALVGVSGCGKSSLLRAGLIPALETGFLAGAGVRWRIAEMRPGVRPIRRLAEALTPLLGSAEAGLYPHEAALLDAELRRGPRGLSTVLEENALPEGANLLLIVDQFEELFRYHRDVDPEETSAFVALLLEAARQKTFPVLVVLAMRSDYLGECALFPGLPEALNDSQFLTPRLTRQQRRAAIEGPAAVFGARVEPALVNQVLNDMGGDPDQLPVMQHLLMRMWQRAVGRRATDVELTLYDYVKAGGFAEALSQHADEAFHSLPEGEPRRIAEVLFHCATERLESRQDSRRPVKIAEVAAVAGVPWGAVADVVEAFRQHGNSFLMPPAGVPLEAETVVDIAHESLIRRWGRLRDWVRDEALRAERYRKLEEDARRWQTRGRKKGWLLRSPELDEALAWRAAAQPTPQWAARYGSGFELVADFLRRSVSRKRWMRLLTVLAATVVGLCIVLAGQLYVTNLQDRVRNAVRLVEQQEQARRDQQQIVLAHELAARSKQARTLALGQLDLSALLAVESVRRVRTLQGAEALRETVRLLPPRPTASTTVAVATQLAFSADGRTLTVVAPVGVRVLEVGGEKGRRRLSAMVEGWRVLAIDPTGRFAAVRQPGASIVVVELETGRHVGRPMDDPGTFGVQFVLGERRTLALYTGAGVRLLSPDGRRPSRVELPPHDVAVLSRDARFVATWSEHGGLVEVRSLDRGRLVFRFNVGTSVVTGLDFSPDGGFLAAVASDGLVRAWSLERGAEVGRVMPPPSRSTVIRGLSLGWRAESVAVASTQSTQVFDLRDARHARELIRVEGRGALTSMAFSSDGRYFAASGFGGTAVWAIRPGAEALHLLLERPVTAVAMSPDKRLLATAIAATVAGDTATDPDSGEVAVWEVEAGTRLYGEAQPVGVAELRFSRDGRMLRIAQDDGRVRRLDLERLAEGRQSLAAEATGSGEPVRLQEIELACGAAGRFAAASADGTYVAVTGNGTVCLTPVDSGSSPQQVRVDRSMVALSQDGGIAAFVGLDRTVRVLARQVPAAPDARAAEADRAPRQPVELTPIGELATPVHALALSPEGSFLAVGTWRPGVEILELVGARRRAWVARDSVVRAIAFSADGRKLVSGGEDGSARVWGLTAANETATELSRVAHPDPLAAVGFSADEEYLITASDRTVRVVRWRPEDLIGEACDRLRRNLTADEWAQHLPGEAERETCPNLPATDDDASLTERLVARIVAGRPVEALALLQDAEGRGETVNWYKWNLVCWYGSLWGYARQMEPACERAVELDAGNAAVRDSRGLARALAGAAAPAIADFRFFLANGDPSPRERDQRQRWIRRLEQGLDPLEPEEIRQLASE